MSSSSWAIPCRETPMFSTRRDFSKAFAPDRIIGRNSPDICPAKLLGLVKIAHGVRVHGAPNREAGGERGDNEHGGSSRHHHRQAVNLDAEHQAFQPACRVPCADSPEHNSDRSEPRGVKAWCSASRFTA